jgi:WD40 repeat protein
MSLPVIPDHTLLRPIGRGAYGEVWLARNLMGTHRAIKVIWRRQFESARPFEREFAGIQRYEPVSRSSGGLVHVLHVGKNEAEEYFYYVMELADNANPRSNGETASPQHSNTPTLQHSDSYLPRTLRADLKRFGRLSTADCLRLAIDVASGLGQLHRHGLIHRDVKPGNIIYVNDRAKLADIGLVTADGEGRTFVGTEGYIPPEGPGSPAADLYALGVVLYETSTGLPPERFPDVPPEWFASPAGDQALELHEIILKACEGQRERRYSTAATMQADLALLQSGQSIRHTRALQRRYARLRMTGMIGTTLLVVALATAFFTNYRARLASQSRAKEAQLRQQAQQAQARAESAEHEAQRQLQAALFEEARALVLSKELGHRAKALDAIRRAAGSTNRAELRRVAFAALSLPDLRLEHEIHLAPEVGFASLWQLDPKLERLAIASNPQEPITIRSIPELRVLATLPVITDLDAYVAKWSPDGRFLAIKRQYDEAGSRSDLEVWNVGRTQLLFTAKKDIAYASFSFHPRLARLMVGHTGGAVSVWDLESGTESSPLRLPDTPWVLAYSPGGEIVAASYYLGSKWVVAFHDSTNGRRLGVAECPDPAASMTWHPRGQWVSYISAGTSDSALEVRLITVEDGSVTVLGRHQIKATSTTFSPDGNYVMSCGWDRDLRCWDLRTRQRVFTCPDAGYTLDWSSDGTHCAMLPKGHPLQFYAFDPPACLELTGNRGARRGPGAFAPNGQFLAIPDTQNLCVWDLSSSSRPALVPADEGPLLSFFSADSSELFAVSGLLGEARLRAWRIAPAAAASDAPRLTSLPVAVPSRLNWAAQAGKDLVLTSEEGVRLIASTNLTSSDYRVVKIPPGVGTVSPDGRWLAVTYSFSPSVTVYRLPEVEQVARLAASNLVAGLWFAPAGDELTLIHRSGVEQWDTATWRLKQQQPCFPVSDSYILYTPDGSGVWRVTNFRDTALYDRSTLEPVLPSPANVVPLALSSDGRQLAVSVDDQRFQVWDLPKLRAHFRELGLDWENP